MLNLLNSISQTKQLDIFLMIVIGLGALWFLLLFIDIGFVLTFKTILNKHKKSLTVILNTKYLNLLKIFEIAKENGIEIKENVTNILTEMDKVGFTKHDSELGEKMRAYLSYLGEEARYIINKNKSAFSNGEGEIVITNLKDNEIQLRSNIAMYNADILGFNYWIGFLPTRFIYKLIDQDKVKLVFKKGYKAKVAYHTPCHMERLGWGIFSTELIKMIPGVELTVLDSNCCGIAGTYGFKKENYEVSQAIGKPLFDQIAKLKPDYVACDCETCKWQIEMSTGKEVKNPISILAEALDLIATSEANK